jgi:hypothetical protein
VTVFAKHTQWDSKSRSFHPFPAVFSLPVIAEASARDLPQPRTSSTEAVVSQGYLWRHLTTTSRETRRSHGEQSADATACRISALHYTPSHCASSKRGLRSYSALSMHRPKPSTTGDVILHRSLHDVAATRFSFVQRAAASPQHAIAC